MDGQEPVFSSVGPPCPNVTCFLKLLLYAPGFAQDTLYLANSSYVCDSGILREGSRQNCDTCRLCVSFIVCFELCVVFIITR